DSKDSTKPVVCAVNCVGHPAAAASVPAFPVENFVQRCARTHGRHRAQRSRMRFFFDRAFSKKFLNFLFSSECMLGLVVKFRFLLLFRRFHSTDRNLCSSDLVPPTI